MADNFEILVRMHNVSDGHNYDDVFTVHRRELIADLMTRAIETYNGNRDCTVTLHPNSPFTTSANGDRYPPRGSIFQVYQTCGELQQYVRQQNPESLAVRPGLYACVIAEGKK